MLSVAAGKRKDDAGGKGGVERKRERGTMGPDHRDGQEEEPKHKRERERGRRERERKSRWGEGEGENRPKKKKSTRLT